MFWHDKCSSRACLARIMECLVVMCAFYLPTKTLPRSSQDIKDGKIIGRGRNWIKNVGEPGRYLEECRKTCYENENSFIVMENVLILEDRYLLLIKRKHINF